MMITAILAIAAPVYMDRASYPAASPIKDAEALGGHGTSNNLPQTISQNSPQDLLTISRSNDKVTVQITNKSTPALWLRAADGNLIAWLEAKVGDTWQPIQYHY